jgi:hypothetical protein
MAILRRFSPSAFDRSDVITNLALIASRSMPRGIQTR